MKKAGKVAYGFLIHYLVGVLVWLTYLTFTYPGGACFRPDCTGVQSMLSYILSDPQFWIVHIPLWPVLIPLDAFTRSWEIPPPFLYEGQV
jgi:hypothetical protein